LGIELFERVAEAQGRILKVDQLVAAGGDPDPSRGPGYLLTFDVGRILVVADPQHDRLLVRAVESPAAVEAIRTASVEEEEPWWRVVGNPATRAWPGSDGEGATAASGDVREVRIQFREDTENPRVVSLRYDAQAVRVGMEGTDGR